MGDTIRVLAGEAFPADGRITVGNTHADEALLTGESTPVARPLGSTVIAGSYNLQLDLMDNVNPGKTLIEPARATVRVE